MDNVMFARLFEILGDRTGEHALTAKTQPFSRQMQAAHMLDETKAPRVAANDQGDIRKFNVAEEFAAARNEIVFNVVTVPNLKQTTKQMVSSFKNGVSSILRIGGDFVADLFANANLGVPQTPVAQSPVYGGNVLAFKKRILT